MAVVTAAKAAKLVLQIGIIFMAHDGNFLYAAGTKGSAQSL